MLFLLKKKPIEPVAPLSPSWKVGLFLSEPRESAKRSLVYDIPAQQIRKSGNQFDDILLGTQAHRRVERSEVQQRLREQVHLHQTLIEWLSQPECLGLNAAPAKRTKLFN